ncbi:hypothetical protein V865_005567 [Kwoniella europaea PYCC6329]|uniref:Uncharacterized protein n=1 Tax=Kwoniella europaea PYCC6329 TaxID=1423913 RepID=A0AAX4KLY4_9TREE
MSDSIPLPPRYHSNSRPSSVPPNTLELTKRSPPHLFSSSSTERIPPAKYSRMELNPPNASNRRFSAPPVPSPNPTQPDRRVSFSTSAPRQSAQQLAAEALLNMAPSSNGQNRSPEKRPSEKTPLVPAPAQSATSTPASRSNTNAMDVDTPESESRGVKRKVVEDDPRLPSAVTLGLHGIDRERERAKESRYSHSPLATTEARQPNPPAANASRLGQSPSSSVLGASTTNRYSVYGPTTRDPLGGSPWGLNPSRYSTLGLRRDLSPSVSTSAAPKPASLDPPQRASPDVGRDSRFYPGSVTGYGHYSMGRRELTEHREQLREGKRWLEAMLSKTEKMLHMVENKMALTGEMGPTAGTAKPPTATAGGRHADDWEFEERERLRQKEIQRLEREREMDRVEREKRGLERERDLQRERERDRLGGNANAGVTSDSGPGVRRDNKSEAERNRDLLLASRRVTAVSPNPSTSSSSSRQQNSNSNGPSATTGGNNASSANSTPNNRETNNNNNGGIGTRDGKGSNGSSPWEGEPILGGVALPRREQQSSLSRALGRGLWSFDVRG